MVVRLYETEDKMIRNTVKLIHEGRYAAEVPVELIEDDTGWSPYLSLEDAKKLDAVRLALRRGEVAEAAKHGRVFELTPVAAK
jgi:hypothetical protein